MGSSCEALSSEGIAIAKSKPVPFLFHDRLYYRPTCLHGIQPLSLAATLSATINKVLFVVDFWNLGALSAMGGHWSIGGGLRVG